MNKPCGHSCDEIIPKCIPCKLAQKPAYALKWGCPMPTEKFLSSHSYPLVAPKGHPNKWQGHRTAIIPRLTIAIPHLDTLDLLQVAVNLWRHSTIPVYFIIVDTGSPPEVCDQLEGMRRSDLEIHYIRGSGYCHSSQPVALAMDLAFNACVTEYLISTHTDVFIKKREFAEWLKRQCNPECPVVGWEMSPRMNPEWKGCVGHASTIWHMPTMRKYNVWWNLARWYEEHGPSPTTIGWPDTETGPNWCLKKAGIVPKLHGREGNFELFSCEWYDHTRSYPGWKIADPNSAMMKKIQGYFLPAFNAAKKRLAHWSGADRTELCDHLGKKVIKKKQDDKQWYECEKGHGVNSHVCPCSHCRSCKDYEVSG